MALKQAINMESLFVCMVPVCERIDETSIHQIILNNIKEFLHSGPKFDKKLVPILVIGGFAFVALIYVSSAYSETLFTVRNTTGGIVAMVEPVAKVGEQLRDLGINLGDNVESITIRAFDTFDRTINVGGEVAVQYFEIKKITLLASFAEGMTQYIGPVLAAIGSTVGVVGRYFMQSSALPEAGKIVFRLATGIRMSSEPPLNDAENEDMRKKLENFFSKKDEKIQEIDTLTKELNDMEEIFKGIATTNVETASNQDIATAFEKMGSTWEKLKHLIVKKVIPLVYDEAMWYAFENIDFTDAELTDIAVALSRMVFTLTQDTEFQQFKEENMNWLQPIDNNEWIVRYVVQRSRKRDPDIIWKRQTEEQYINQMSDYEVDSMITPLSVKVYTSEFGKRVYLNWIETEDVVNRVRKDNPDIDLLWTGQNAYIIKKDDVPEKIFHEPSPDVVILAGGDKMKQTTATRRANETHVSLQVLEIAIVSTELEIELVSIVHDVMYVEVTIAISTGDNMYTIRWSPGSNSDPLRYKCYDISVQSVDLEESSVTFLVNKI